MSDEASENLPEGWSVVPILTDGGPAVRVETPDGRTSVMTPAEADRVGRELVSLVVLWRRSRAVR